MSKVLRTAALIVGAVAVVAAGIATANPGLVIAGVKIGTIATIASVAAGVLTLAATLTAKKPKGTDYQATGSPEQFTLDPDGPLPCIFGRFATAGRAIYRRTWDTADAGTNDRRSWVIILSLGACYSIQSFAADKVVTAFDGGGAATGPYSGYMWQTTQLGASPEANALGFGSGAGTPPDWDTTRKLSGLCAATWTLRFDTTAKIYQTGTPAPRWVVQGVPCYDPRLDSTYPGGSGSQRANDRTTWAYSNNPHLAALSYALGYVQNGQRVFGIGAPVAQIDVAAFVEGANTSDLNGWKIGGAAFSTDKKWDTLKALLQAGMAEPLQLGAKISCFTNAPKVSLATITTEDVVGAASVTATQPRRDRINGIVPCYWQEANDWQFLSGTAVRVSDYETADGGRRTKEVDYNFIPDADGNDQIATACRYDIENAREFGPITLPLKLRWIGFKPGDCVTANLPELGLNSQSILLLNRDFDPGAGIPTFTARSETSAKHAFALGQTSAAPPTPGVSSDPLVPVPGSTAWAITATQVSASGVVVPALVMQGAVDSPVAEAIVVEYRKYVSGQAADVNWISETTLQPDANKTIITSLQPGTAYEVAISYRRRGVTGTRTIYGPSTTAALPGAQVVQGSSDGSSFHYGLQTGDLYMRTSNDGGATFGTPVRIAGEGEGSGQYQQFVFKVSGTQPATPSGNGIPSGWSDGPVSGTPVWYSVATQVEGVTQSGWSTPTQLTGAKGDAGSDGANGANGLSAVVQGSVNGTTGWHTPPTTNDRYIRVSNDNGVTFGAAVLVKGSDGAPGTNGTNGQTFWDWTAYADSPDGATNFTTGSPGGRGYQGTAQNQSSPIESTNPADYVWGLYRGPATFGLVAMAGVAIGPDYIVRTAAFDYVWDASAYSSEGWKSGASVSFKPASASGSFMCGLNTDPTTDASYASIDYAWFCAGDGSCAIYESGAGYGGGPGNTSATYSAGDRFQISYDNKKVRYYHNGTLVREVAATADLTLYLDTSLLDANVRISSIAFGPNGSTGDKGDKGDTGGQGAPGAPRYPATRIAGTGTFALGTVIMTNGQSVDVMGSLPFSAAGSFGASVTMQAQYSTDGSSWSAMGGSLPSNNQSVGVGESDEVNVYGSHQNTSGGDQPTDFRIVVTVGNPSHPPYYGNGAGQITG